jgi:hypothetical protein
VSPTALEIVLPPDAEVGATGGGYTVTYDSAADADENEALLDSYPGRVAYDCPSAEIAIVVVVPDTDPQGTLGVPGQPGKKYRPVARIYDEW